MVFSFLYLAVRALLGLLVRCRRGPDVKDVELLVLRHEIAVLRRQVGRPKLRRADRALFAAAACHLSPASRLSLLVSPRTLLRWHQSLVCWKWREWAYALHRLGEGLRPSGSRGNSSFRPVQRSETGGLIGARPGVRSTFGPVSLAYEPELKLGFWRQPDLKGAITHVVAQAAAR
jgi:hypothetical protein